MAERIDPIRGDIGELKHAIERLTEVVKGLHGLDKRIETVKSDLIAWSFVFWVGAVGALAVLAGVLRR